MKSPKSILKLKNKDVIIFDLDGTLTESKASLDQEMSNLLCELLQQKKVAIIGGGSFKQFKEQFLKYLKCPNKNLKNLFLFPTNSTAFYKFKKNKWIKIYELKLKKIEIKKILNAFKETFKKLNYKNPPKTYGPIIENRKSQITFSALGQNVIKKMNKDGLKLKQNWYKKNNKLRIKMAKFLQKLLPEFEVKIGGLTSIDITYKNIDKAYGIIQISKQLNTKISKMVFIGDALFKGGNDYPAKKTKILAIQVENPKETKKIIKQIL
ncbi:MAG: HAD-IIB family hydrolase, partial [Patescibacteria group bacterium]|nr:HAD-IIB family hydrolase [Patescibacteria group bacterium]